jgi:hypothetical protein
MRNRRAAGIAVLVGAVLGLGALGAEEPPDYLRRTLSPAGEPASRVNGFAIDPRGEWVAFVGDVELAGADAVYAMRRNGADLHRLSAYGSFGGVTRVDFSADGRRVVYQGDLEVDGRSEIWSVVPWGSPATAVKLNVPVVGAGVGFLRLAPVGNRIVYVAQTVAGQQAWSVPATGPSALGARLDPPLEADEMILALEFSPDAARVALQFLDNSAQTARVFAAPVAGPASAAVLLADTIPGDCAPFFTRFTPDSARALYIGFCPPGFVPRQVWSVPAGGPANAAVSLAGSFATGGSIQGLLVSPDSQRVVFSADRLVDERVELWSVPVAGPAAAIVRLNPTLVANGDVQTGFQISPDSTRVAYIADQVSDERFFPYSVPIAGPSSEAVSLYQGVLMVGADARDLAFTPDSSRVVFRFDLAVNERFDLYWAPSDGSAVQARITNRGSNPAPDRSVTFRWHVHPDGERVLYHFDEFAPSDERGIGEQRFTDPYPADLRLDGVPVTGGRVDYFELYPDSAGIVYQADELADGKAQLFTVDLRVFGDGFEAGSPDAWSDVP